LNRAARALRAQTPNAEIICVNTPETRKIEIHAAEIDRWITHGADTTGAWDLVRKLRSLDSEAVCILYQSEKPKAHLKLELLAALIGCHRPLFGAFTPDHSSLRKMGRMGLCLRVGIKTLVLLGRSAAAGILAITAGAMLCLAGLLTRPGECLGAPAAGEPAEQDAAASL
jgi:hypothetical protein